MSAKHIHFPNLCIWKWNIQHNLYNIKTTEMLWENKMLLFIRRGSDLLEVKPSATRTTRLSLSVSVWLSVETLSMMWDLFFYYHCWNDWSAPIKVTLSNIFYCLVCLNAQFAEVDNLVTINWTAKIDDAKLWIMFWLKSVLVLYFLRF